MIISFINKDKDSAHIQINDKEWELYENSCEFLSVFNHATEAMSSSIYPSIQKVAINLKISFL